MSKWPDKHEREAFEISGLIAAYARLRSGAKLVVVSKSERPDYVVRNDVTGEEIGVELTSAYLDNRSVPDLHKSCSLLHLPYLDERFADYQARLVSAVAAKIMLARGGYDVSRPLLLSVYINEYEALCMGKREMEAVIADHPETFSDIVPFREIVFWNLPGGECLIVSPR